MSRLDESLLRAVARRTHGGYFSASRPGGELPRLLASLGALARSARGSRLSERPVARFRVASRWSRSCCWRSTCCARGGAARRSPRPPRRCIPSAGRPRRWCSCSLLGPRPGARAERLGAGRPGLPGGGVGRGGVALRAPVEARGAGGGAREPGDRAGEGRAGGPRRGASWRRWRAHDTRAGRAAGYNLGTLLGERGELERALAALRATLKRDPSDEDARWNYEVLLRRLQQREEPKHPKPEPQRQPAGGGGGAARSRRTSAPNPAPPPPASRAAGGDEPRAGGAAAGRPRGARALAAGTAAEGAGDGREAGEGLVRRTRAALTLAAIAWPGPGARRAGGGRGRGAAGAPADVRGRERGLRGRGERRGRRVGDARLPAAGRARGARGLAQPRASPGSTAEQLPRRSSATRSGPCVRGATPSDRSGCSPVVRSSPAESARSWWRPTAAAATASSGAASLLVEVEPREPWVGEPVVLRVRLVLAQDLAEEPAYVPPVTTGFWAEAPSRPESYVRHAGGAPRPGDRDADPPLSAGAGAGPHRVGGGQRGARGAGWHGPPALGSPARRARRELTLRSQPIERARPPAAAGSAAGIRRCGGDVHLAPGRRTARAPRRTSRSPCGSTCAAWGTCPWSRPRLWPRRVERCSPARRTTACPLRKGLRPAGGASSGTCCPATPGALAIAAPAFAWFDPATGGYRSATLPAAQRGGGAAGVLGGPRARGVPRSLHA